MKRQIIIFICLICLVLVGFGTQTKPVGATGNNFYVSTTGSDNNPGTLAQPWFTIQHAANVAKAGDTVNIEAGTYTSTALSFSNNGSSGNPITFQNYNGGTVNIVINDTAYDAIMLGYGPSANYLTFSGFNVSAPTDFIGIDIWGGHINVQNCYVTNCKDTGIGAEPSATYVTVDGCTVTGTNTTPSNEMISFVGVNGFEIKNCLVHDPASAFRCGIDCKQGCSNGSIHNNVVHDIEDCPIYIDAQGIATSNINVYDNLVYNCKNNPGLALSDEFGSATITNINYYNNIVYNCRQGFTTNQVGTETRNFSLINNTFYNNQNYDPGTSSLPGDEIWINTPSQYLNNCIIRNNIIYGLTAGAYAIYYPGYANGGLSVDHNLFYNSGGTWASSNVLGTSYVTGNPLLVSPSTNFALQSNSPAIDAGSATSAPPTDYIGNSWPQGAGYDIGAYE